jgi:hypothetical protein
MKSKSQDMTGAKRSERSTKLVKKAQQIFEDSFENWLPPMDDSDKQ